MTHIIFFDGHCLLCHRAVRYILFYDKRKKFLFAPLDGQTAKTALKSPVQQDSLILLENYGEERSKVYIEGKAVLRICWLLGGGHLIWGWMVFLPSFAFDWIYRYMAKRRYQWFPPTNLPSEETFEHRLLP
jgi:predicted DCC family thiol-disulfide oxidoreductase YuxK